MKKALNLVITYFFFLVLGLILGTILYSIFLDAKEFIAGNEIHFFSNTELISSLFYVSYCMVLLICPLISYYRVRHPGGISQTIAYIIICLFTWFLIFPAINSLNNLYDRKHPQKEITAYLSDGYFRKADDKVYFFTEEFKSSYPVGASASAVIIDTAEEGAVSFGKVQNSPDFSLNSQAVPYRETQLKNNFHSSGISVPVNLGLLISQGRKALNEGIIKYLGFLSMAILIGILYMFTYFFDWRLLNTCVLMVTTAAVYYLNSFFYLPVSSVIKEKLSNSFFVFLGDYLNEPLLVFLNLLFSLLILVTGILKVVIKKHMEKNR